MLWIAIYDGELRETSKRRTMKKKDGTICTARVSARNSKSGRTDDHDRVDERTNAEREGRDLDVIRHDRRKQGGDGDLVRGGDATLRDGGAGRCPSESRALRVRLELRRQRTGSLAVTLREAHRRPSGRRSKSAR